MQVFRVYVVGRGLQLLSRREMRAMGATPKQIKAIVDHCRSDLGRRHGLESDLPNTEGADAHAG